jgi:virginiamycin B lyase
MFYASCERLGTLVIACLIGFGINTVPVDSDSISSTVDKAFYAFAIGNSPTSPSQNTTTNNNKSIMNESNIAYSNTDPNNTTPKTKIIETLSEKEKQFLCGDNIPKSNHYIEEFLVNPILCGGPVGIAVDDKNNIWIGSGRAGHIFMFNPQSNAFDKSIPIPNWPNQEDLGSRIWDMKFDKNGNLWFTDEKSGSIWKYFTKEGKFENYRLPGKGAYPLSLVLDTDNNVWFTQINGKGLGFLNQSQVENNSSKGISELDMSKQVQSETMGPISKGYEFEDNNNTDTGKAHKIFWFSTVSYPVGGQLVKYNDTDSTLTIHELTHTHSVPISVAEDEKGNVWTNDFPSSLFLMLDPKTGHTKHYSTSFPSTANTTTLPYYNEYKNGKVWFNEHYGNAIAFFDPENKTLVEYGIPSKNMLWGNNSNALRFTFDNNGSVWFTEWTENKIGVLPKEKMNSLPISLSVSKDKMVIDSKRNKGDTIDVSIYPNKLNDSGNTANITMFVTSSISKNGALTNLTSNFSQTLFSIKNPTYNTTAPAQPLKTTLEIKPTEKASPGNYTLTISARHNNEITYSKIIDLAITDNGAS